MTIKDIFSAEESNCNNITLYKEGIFYKAYEKSAYAFVINVKNYSPVKKFIKTISCDVVSIGFPCSVLEKISSNIKIIESNQNQIVIRTNEINENAFTEWKNSIALTVTEPKVAKEIIHNCNCGNFSETIEAIKNFAVESKTPMECMIFISDLKKIINGNI